MDDTNLKRAVTVLERRPEVGLPLMVLHAAMHRAGATNLTLAALEGSLRDHGELFAVIDPPPLPWDTDAWPSDAMSRYRDALHDLGFAAETFIVLRPGPAETRGLVARLRATVSALCDGASGSPSDVARTLLAANAVSASWRLARRRAETSRPTTLPPGRRPPGRGRRYGLPRSLLRLPSA